jgi:8-oxo-dGTP diphosphatase
MYAYDYPRPMVTADVVLFAGEGADRAVLLIRRAREPFKNGWALPGGFVEERETLEACAARELAEETGISGVALRQVRAFSAPDRDPRGRTITVAFVGHVPERLPPTGGDDAAEARWWPLRDLPPLAFDHAQIIAAAESESLAVFGRGSS